MKKTNSDRSGFNSGWQEVQGFSNSAHNIDPSKVEPDGENRFARDIAKIMLDLSDQTATAKRELNKLKAEVDAQREKIDSEEEKVKGVVRQLKESTDVLSQGIIDTRNKTLEPLAIFVGLFTFASIGFQIFANIRDHELWSALLVIIAGVLVVFAGLVVHASSIANDVPKRRNITAGIVGIGLILALTGASMYHTGVKVLDYKYRKDCVEIQANDESEDGKKYCLVQK